MAVTEFFAGIPVSDFEAVLPWYERLMGTASDFFPHEHEAVWRITEHAWVYVVEDADRAGRAMITILVDDLDEQIGQLAERGIIAGPIDVIADGVRTAAVADPDGNRITFGQPPPYSSS